MCKIMIIPGIKPELSDNAKRFAKAARPILTKDDNHAFGYAAIGDAGLFTEKWTDVTEAFLPKSVGTRGADLIRSLLGLNAKPETDTGYMAYGESTDKVASMILHARWATCGHGIQNAHPFVVDDMALIHNGVITNSAALTNKISTCDSETILNEYLKENVANEPLNIQNVVDRLAGWYAVAVIGKQNDGTYIIDVFKERGADLHAAYVTELDTVVFATKPYLIKAAAKQCGFTVGPVSKVPEDILIRINPYTGELIGNHTPFKSGLIEAQAYWEDFRKRDMRNAALVKNGVTEYHVKDNKLQPIIPDASFRDNEAQAERELLNDINERFNEVVDAYERNDDLDTIPVDTYIKRTGISYADAGKRSTRRKFRKHGK